VPVSLSVASHTPVSTRYAPALGAAADAAGAILQVKVWVRMLDGTNLEPSPDLLGQLRGDMAAKERGDLLCLHAQHRLSRISCSQSGAEPTASGVTADVLALARELRKGTIERVLRMSDLELGLQIRRRPTLPRFVIDPFTMSQIAKLIQSTVTWAKEAINLNERHVIN